jgi:Tol biopolymer transport system component
VARNVEFAGSYLRWAPDGRALIYVLTRHGISNIWRQPLDGGPATQLTDFSSGVISDFNWSPNGDAWFARGPVSRDVVLIRTAK